MFVSRYKESHTRRRRLFKKALKLGEVKLIHRYKDGWDYGIVKGFEDKIHTLLRNTK